MLNSVLQKSDFRKEKGCLRATMPAMVMEETLKRFPEQFAWQPEIVNAEKLRVYKHYIVAGMGGSHLGAWLIKNYGGVSNLTIHRNYGLPAIEPELLDTSLVILSSYSGTTEEVLDTALAASERGLPMAVITMGGKLLEFAREQKLPHVIIPNTGLEPRMAIGYAGIGIADMMLNHGLQKNFRSGGTHVDPMAGQAEGARIGKLLASKIPLIYSSAINLSISYIWKVKFNETAKIPAFCNSFPELCHNELTGFDVVDSTREISSHMYALFLDDETDHERIKVRMKVAGEMLREKGIQVERVKISGQGFAKAFSAALLADWITLELARTYGVPNPQTPMVAEFKKRIAQ